jgi:hypothetical protein
MSHEDRINALIDDLHKRIERMSGELDLGVCDIVGALEFIKADYLDKAPKVDRKKP